MNKYILSYVLNNVDITDELRKEILDKVDLVLKFLDGGLAKAKIIPEEVLDIINKSDANFVKRLKDPNRKFLDFGEEDWGTHKLAWSEDELGTIIYPEILEINGELIDLSNDREKAWKSAIDNKDFVKVPSNDIAEWFTTNYKNYYPNFSTKPSITKHSEGGSLKTTKVTIGNKSYNVEIAEKDEDLKRGLMGRKELPEDEGMLFDFNETGNHEMWMKNTEIPLDQIFLDEDMEVIKVVTREPNDEELIGCEGTSFVLEVNANSGIQIGDLLEFEDEELGDYIMKVLAPDGSVQFRLKGGERIFSRRSTRILIKKAKRAKEDPTDGHFASLGKYLFKELQAQTDRDPEYVESPK